jgi:hypothetical protein
MRLSNLYVIRQLTTMRYSQPSKITLQTSHFRGRLKSKVQPHIQNAYGFVVPDTPKTLQDNITLVNVLKDNYHFTYRVRFFVSFHFTYIRIDIQHEGQNRPLRTPDYPADCQRHVVQQQEG